MDKIIAVVGATGAQGGGLVRAIVNDPNGGFAARAITRKKDSDKARALAKMGGHFLRFFSCFLTARQVYSGNGPLSPRNQYRT